jgi:hypothetical protein
MLVLVSARPHSSTAGPPPSTATAVLAFTQLYLPATKRQRRGGSFVAMRTLLVVFELLFILGQSVPARANDGLRCKEERLVNEGDRMSEVRALCGEPDGAFHRVEKHGIQIDEWTYDLGPESFIRTVIFKNGRVVDIVAGPYGGKQR